MSVYRAIVTGASSGIGLATARRIHADGGTVALIATRDKLLNEIAAELGSRVHVVPTDVSDPSQVSNSPLRLRLSCRSHPMQRS